MAPTSGRGDGDHDDPGGALILPGLVVVLLGGDLVELGLPERAGGLLDGQWPVLTEPGLTEQPCLPAGHVGVADEVMVELGEPGAIEAQTARGASVTFSQPEWSSAISMTDGLKAAGFGSTHAAASGEDVGAAYPPAVFQIDCVVAVDGLGEVDPQPVDVEPSSPTAPLMNSRRTSSSQ